jgi:hypothetical protein
MHGFRLAVWGDQHHHDDQEFEDRAREAVEGHLQPHCNIHILRRESRDPERKDGWRVLTVGWEGGVNEAHNSDS